MSQSSQHILCPRCNVAVNEYHRHCPYCGRELARKISVKLKRFAWWKAALIALPCASLILVYNPLDSAYVEYLLPLLFVASAAGFTVLIYLVANIILSAIRYIRNG